MISYLESLDIPAERKAIYDDLELLRSFGMDIVHVRGKSHGYYLGQRTFELPELKLLIDVVQASQMCIRDRAVPGQSDPLLQPL